jgi:hypothetical protein
MSDVSAVVLTIGEPFVGRALASLAAQTVPPHEVIVVEHVSPFFRALNEAAGRVTTPFFVQVDADMILDPPCLEALRAGVGEDTGMVVAELRDALLGQVVGVKLFRTECVRRTGFRDSISPDTDFGAAIGRRGWATRYIGLPDGEPGARRRTFGEHRPDYTPAYTYRKHILEGSRLRYRGARGGLRWRCERLDASPHPLARLALLALAHGFFQTADGDRLEPWGDEPAAARLLALLESDHRCDAAADLLPLARHPRLRDVYRRFTAAGHAIARAGAGATLVDTLAALAGPAADWGTLVARIGLGHGVLSAEQAARAQAADERALGSFLTLGTGPHAGWWQHLRARVVREVTRIRRPRDTIRW